MNQKSKFNDEILLLIEQSSKKQNQIRKKLRVRDTGISIPLELTKFFNDYWPITILENIVSIRGRIGYHGLTRADYRDEGPILLSVGNISKNGKLNFKKTTHIHDKAFKRSSNIIVEKNDILLSKSGTIGRVGLVEESNSEMTINAAINIFRCGDTILPKYLLYWFRSPTTQTLLDSLAPGIAQRNLFQRELRRLSIPVPTLDFQQNLINKIEKSFLKLDNMKMILTNIKLQLKQYRQSLLKSAFEGKLTEKWRLENPITPASSRWNLSIGSIIDETLPIIPNNWCWRKLEQISKGVVVSFVGPTTKHYVDESNGVMFLRSQNVRKGKINFSGMQYVSYSFHEKEKKSQIKPNYLLIVRVGANRGDTCIAPDSIKIANAGNIIIARVFDDIAPLLNYYFQTDFCQKQLLGMTTGSAQGVINTTNVSQTIIPITPLQEQKEIIKKLDEGIVLIKNTENIINSMILQVEIIRSSILKQAFEGKLVPQDPNDEPAQILLESIKSTKEGQLPKQRRSKNVK